MGDRWNNSSNPAGNNLYNPAYVWLPVEFSGSGEMILRPYVDWTLEVLEGLSYLFKDNTKYPSYISTLSDMPDRISVVDSEGEKTLPIIWTVEKGKIDAKGSMVTLVGTYTDPNNNARTIVKEVFVMPENLEYFIDCGSLSEGSNTNGSIMYDWVTSTMALKNKVADQEYNPIDGWGYVPGSYDGVKNTLATLGLNASGYYGSNDGAINIKYKITLDKGEYRISSGHYEWWNGRTTDVNVFYNDKTIFIDSVKLSGVGDRGVATGTFTIEEDNTLVTVTFAKNSLSSQAGVVSYFAINNETPKEPEQPEQPEEPEIPDNPETPEEPEIPIINEVKDVKIQTVAGTVPKLPAQVDVIYSDGSTNKVPVVWDAVPKDKYSVVGTFVVEGTVEGTDHKAKIVVTVTKKTSSDSESSSGGSSSSSSSTTKAKAKPETSKSEDNTNNDTPSQAKPVKVSISLSKGTASGESGDLNLYVKPYIQDGRTMVGVRDIATLINVESKNIIWDAINKKVVIKTDGREVEFTIGQKYVLVNDKKIEMDVAPEIKDGRVVIPLSHLAKILGIKVEFISATKEVILSIDSY